MKKTNGLQKSAQEDQKGSKKHIICGNEIKLFRQIQLKQDIVFPKESMAINQTLGKQKHCTW